MTRKHGQPVRDGGRVAITYWNVNALDAIPGHVLARLEVFVKRNDSIGKTFTGFCATSKSG